MKYKNIREEELKNKVAQDWFADFDCTEIVGNIDFTVLPRQENIFGRTALLWAEAKTGNYDTTTMFVQLILTIGKARTFDKMLPPTFIGAFDAEKIAFVPYEDIQDIFYINDFNWNVTPSNHQSKEFQLIKNRVSDILNTKTYIFHYEKDEKELHYFIKKNIALASTQRIKIDKNNFISIYLRWLDTVKPIINANWETIKKKYNILDNDFYLADLFVDDKDTTEISDDVSVRENLFVFFENETYIIKEKNSGGLFDLDQRILIKNKATYENFWKCYKRPPLEQWQDYILERKDLLVPQDIRERKGAFFTPRKWVELSQQYLAEVFGENWQDEYYIWDCAAGTGNLLFGLTNKYQIYASTLDQADVKVIHELIDTNRANLVEKHCFQFDFLNDEFLPQSQGGKLPDSLYDIITNEEKRKKLIFYINPPYAEAGNAKTKKGTGSHKGGTATNNKSNIKYKTEIKKASNEVFAQFLIRIYDEIPNAKIANFSTLKNLQGSNFKDFRNIFRAKLEKIFLVPADTFDNVKGKFPISFQIWNTEIKEVFKYIKTNVYNRDGFLFLRKNIYSYDDTDKITLWITNNTINYSSKNHIGLVNTGRTDFQHQSLVYIQNDIKDKGHSSNINNYNLIKICIFFSIRHTIPADWLNDRDQFLYPNEGWQTDTQFQNNCLAFTLFHSQNRISSAEGVNHWIPFTEKQVNAKERFKSHFMTDFIGGKHAPKKTELSLFSEEELEKVTTNKTDFIPREPLVFSPQAQAVFDAGQALWKYYHQQPNANVNASLYDIREHFQGRNSKGKMNNKSDDAVYTELLSALKEKLGELAEEIKPKIYQYGFLKA